MFWEISSEIIIFRYGKIHLKTRKKEKKKKKKTSNSDGCAEICGERGRREGWPTSHFEDRNSKSKLDVWSSRLDFLRSKNIPITKSQFDPTPFLHTPSQFSSYISSRGRAGMWDRGGGKERKERRDSEVRLRTSNLGLRTSNFELRSVKLATSSFAHSVLNEITAITNHASDCHQIERVASRRKTFPS